MFQRVSNVVLCIVLIECWKFWTFVTCRLINLGVVGLCWRVIWNYTDDCLHNFNYIVKLCKFGAFSDCWDLITRISVRILEKEGSDLYPLWSFWFLSLALVDASVIFFFFFYENKCLKNLVRELATRIAICVFSPTIDLELEARLWLLSQNAWWALQVWCKLIFYF